MTSALRWPETDPVESSIRLRTFEDRDVPMARELSTDPYVPLIGSLPAAATDEQALVFIKRQRARLAQGIGFCFCIAERTSGVALGSVEL